MHAYVGKTLCTAVPCSTNLHNEKTILIFKKDVFALFSNSHFYFLLHYTSIFGVIFKTQAPFKFKIHFSKAMGIIWFIVAWLCDKQRTKILQLVIYGKIQIYLKNSSYYMWKYLIFHSFYWLLEVLDSSLKTNVEEFKVFFNLANIKTTLFQ